jgi:secondary thiamine-phosphate synthase enzyme
VAGKSLPRSSATTSITQTGEDNGDAHLKSLIMHHEVIVPVTNGKLDFGPWQQIFYAEVDGQRDKRVIVKVMGE